MFCAALGGTSLFEMSLSAGADQLANILRYSCFAHAARTCSSVANSPRAAASFEEAIAARSSTVRVTAGISSPASCNTSRAISSCVSGGRLRAASTARSSNFVMGKAYAFRNGAGSKKGASFHTGLAWPGKVVTSQYELYRKCLPTQNPSFVLCPARQRCVGADCQSYQNVSRETFWYDLTLKPDKT